MSRICNTLQTDKIRIEVCTHFSSRVIINQRVNIFSRKYEYNQQTSTMKDVISLPTRRNSRNFSDDEKYQNVSSTNTEEPIISATCGQLNKRTQKGEEVTVPGWGWPWPRTTRRCLGRCRLPRLAWLLEALGAIWSKRLTGDEHLWTNVIADTLEARDEPLGTLTFTATQASTIATSHYQYAHKMYKYYLHPVTTHNWWHSV